MSTKLSTMKKKKSIHTGPKVNGLINRWVLPLNNYNLKIWINPTTAAYSNPSIGIGLGTMFKPNIFAFVILDENSVYWLEHALNEATEVYKTKKSKTKDSSTILWEKKIDLDKLRKISMGLSVIKKHGNKSLNLMINSKAFLFTDLNFNQVNWLLTTLSIAKNSLEALPKHEPK